MVLATIIVRIAVNKLQSGWGSYLPKYNSQKPLTTSDSTPHSPLQPRLKEPIAVACYTTEVPKKRALLLYSPHHRVQSNITCVDVSVHTYPKVNLPHEGSTLAANQYLPLPTGEDCQANPVHPLHLELDPSQADNISFFSTRESDGGTRDRFCSYTQR